MRVSRCGSEMVEIGPTWVQFGSKKMSESGPIGVQKMSGFRVLGGFTARIEGLFVDLKGATFLDTRTSAVRV